MADMQLSERIKADDITCTYTARDTPPEDAINPSPDTQWYDVILHMDDREFAIPFGLNVRSGNIPTTEDVMSLVIIGTRSIEYNPTYAQWCNDWGFMPSDETKRILFTQWEQIRNRLRAFLRDKFSEYMSETEDDI